MAGKAASSLSFALPSDCTFTDGADCSPNVAANRRGEAASELSRGLDKSLHAKVTPRFVNSCWIIDSAYPR